MRKILAVDPQRLLEVSQLLIMLPAHRVVISNDTTCIHVNLVNLNALVRQHASLIDDGETLTENH